jgi:hypothetical protein
MTQINSIKLGVIVMCVATVTLSLAQTPRIGTSGSNQTGATNRATAGHSGLSGNFTGATQLGTTPPSSMSTGPNTNAGTHIGINARAQINPTGGTIGGPAAGLSGLSGNSTATTQTGTNVRAGTNTTANTNAGAHTAAAAATRANVNIIQPQLIPVPIRSPLPNNSPIGSNFSTAGESPSPLPSASVTPTPTLTPAQLL